MKSILQFIIFSGLSAAAMADTILPMPGPESIRLRFDKDITTELKDVISNDFNKCFCEPPFHPFQAALLRFAARMARDDEVGR